MTTNPFDDERLHGARSALVKMNPDDQGRYTFDLMCQYTRMGLHGLEVGDLIGVENYTPGGEGERIYSVLSISRVFPSHFAAQGDGAYPGHIFESMGSIKEDWESQQDKPLHLTTIIEIQAVPTGFQFSFISRSSDELPQLEEEQNLPMIGARVRPLSMEMVDSIINQGLGNEPDSPLDHKKFEDLNLKLDQESLLTTHFGIFGFTGVGKSNLVSSMVSSLCFENEEPLSNFIIFDPNDEYLGLFVDKFTHYSDEALYIHVGADSLHEFVAREIGRGDDPSEDVIRVMSQQLRLPPALQNLKSTNKQFEEAIEEAIVGVFHRTFIALPFQNIAELVRDKIKEETPEQSGPQAKDVVREMTDAWILGYESSAVNPTNIRNAISRANQNTVTSPYERLNDRVSAKTTVRGIHERVIGALRRELRNLENVSPNAILQVSDLIERITTVGSRQIVIITGRRDSDIKHFASFLGNRVYDARRQDVGRLPFVTFMFDEADLFIKQASSDKDTADVRELCVTIARRGRKFGLGLGISTQRSSLLDTEVMANLHTYFVSKLPRADDRERVAEAFGISKDQLTPTFTFAKGNWLVISHDATGLKGVPIPTRAIDANDRISNDLLN